MEDYGAAARSSTSYARPRAPRMDGSTGWAPRAAPISLTAAERDALLRLLPPAVHCDDADCPLEDPLSALVDAARERLEGNTLEATAS